MSLPLDTPAAVRAEIRNIADALALARETVQGDGFADLAGLEGRVEQACAAATALPAAQARALEADLAELIARLDGLAADLAAQRDRVAALFDKPAGPGPTAAAAAYRRPRG